MYKNYREVFEALLRGDRVRRTWWKDDRYIYLSPDGDILNERDAKDSPIFDSLSQWSQWEKNHTTHA